MQNKIVRVIESRAKVIRKPKDAPCRSTMLRRWKAQLRQKNAGKRLELSHLRTVGAFGKIRFAGERINPIAQQLAA